MLKTVRLNTGNVEFTPRKPFDLLRDVKLVPLSGASGTPVELFVQSIATLSRIEVDLLTRSTVAAESSNPVTPT